MPSRKPSPTKLENIRAELIVRHGLCCWYCGWILLPGEITLDHVVPQSAGGEWTLNNLVLACECCNTQKANLPIEIFRLYRWLTRGRRDSRRRRAVEALACVVSRHTARIRFAGEIESGVAT